MVYVYVSRALFGNTTLGFDAPIRCARDTSFLVFCSKTRSHPLARCAQCPQAYPQWHRLPPALAVQAPIPQITSKQSRYERLSILAGIARRRSMRHGSLKPTLVKPVQKRNQIKISPINATKQKGKQHHIEERFKQTIVLQNSLIETLRAQISEKPHQCPECPKFFKRSDHVRSHIKHKHPTLVSSINNTYCEECDKHFTRPIYLAHHTCSPNSLCKYVLLRCKMSILTRFSYSSFIPLWAMSYKLVFVVFSYPTHGIRKTPPGLKAFYGSGLEFSPQRRYVMLSRHDLSLTKS